MSFEKEIGKHCELAECQQLDFLPFQCEHCLKYFCDSHYRYHGCESKQSLSVDDHYQQQRASSSSKDVLFKCQVPRCKKKEFIKIICSVCKLNTCVG